jgi:hypothetical protein
MLLSCPILFLRNCTCFPFCLFLFSPTMDSCHLVGFLPLFTAERVHIQSSSCISPSGRIATWPSAWPVQYATTIDCGPYGYQRANVRINCPIGGASHPANTFALIVGKFLGGVRDHLPLIEASRALLMPRRGNYHEFQPTIAAFDTPYIFAAGTVSARPLLLAEHETALRISISESVMDEHRHFQLRHALYLPHFVVLPLIDCFHSCVFPIDYASFCTTFAIYPGSNVSFFGPCNRRSPSGLLTIAVKNFSLCSRPSSCTLNVPRPLAFRERARRLRAAYRVSPHDLSFHCFFSHRFLAADHNFTRVHDLLARP